MVIVLSIICFVVVALVIESLLEIFDGEDWYD